MLRLFVYGSLKRGYDNHERYCATATRIEPAHLWGRLYGLKYGFPALELPEDAVLASGSPDPLVDLRRQQVEPGPAFGAPAGDWDFVHGELITLADPVRDLPPIDRLEAFRPGARSLYQRSLAPVRTGTAVVVGWVYWMRRVRGGERLHSGIWRT